MTTEEMYEFDLRGFIVYRNVLLPKEVKRVWQILAGVRGAEADGKFSFLKLDPYFMELLAHQRTLSFLKVSLGDWLRFDHAFGIEMTRERSINENLHAGPLQNQRSFWY